MVLRQRPRLGQRLRGQWHQRQPLCRRRRALGLLGRHLDRVTPGGGKADLRWASHRAAHAQESRDLLAGLSAPLRWIEPSRGGRRLPSGGQRLGGVGPHVRPRHGVTRNLSRLPRLSLQHDAGDLFRAAQQPHADRGWLLAIRLRVRPVRYGGTRRIDGSGPGHRAEQHLRAHELLVSRRLRSTRLRLQRQRRAELELARLDGLCHRGAQPQGRVQRHVHRSAQRTRAQPHAAAVHLQRERSRERRVSGRRRAAPVPGVGARTSCRPAGTSTIERRRSGSSPRISGRSAVCRCRAVSATTAPGAGRRPTATGRRKPHASTRTRFHSSAP